MDKYRCVAMREGRSWKQDLDLFGVAAIAHAMLYGKPLAVEKKGLTWAATSKLRRYWNQELWRPFFHQLINPQDPGNPCLNVAHELAQQCTAFRQALAEPSVLQEHLRKERDLVSKQSQ